MDHFHWSQSHIHTNKDQLVATVLLPSVVRDVTQGRCFKVPILKAIIPQFFISQHFTLSLTLIQNHHYHPIQQLTYQYLPIHTCHSHKLLHCHPYPSILVSHTSKHLNMVHSRSYLLQQHILGISTILNASENLYKSTNILY